MVDIRVVLLVLFIITLSRKRITVEFSVVIISPELRLLLYEKNLLIMIFVVIKWPDFLIVHNSRQLLK